VSEEPNTDEGNARYQLRAYEHTNACRAAFLIRWLARPEGGDPTPLLDRKQLIKAWGSRYPRHQSSTGRSRIPARIGRALNALAAAGIIDVDPGRVRVLSPTLLAMSADNLAIVEGPDGVALPPASWRQRPACPPGLLAVQDALYPEQNGTDSAPKRSCSCCGRQVAPLDADQRCGHCGANRGSGTHTGDESCQPARGFAPNPPAVDRG
jgi:hypothetical protein